MDYKLECKLAFLTGAAKGIGKATAALLGREGDLHGRSRESLEGAQACTAIGMPLA